MELIEFYRARTALYWHLGIVAAVTLLLLMLGHQADIDVTGPGGTSRITSGTVIPLAGVAPIAAFFAAIVASTLGTSLNRENLTREISWTKPLSRTAIALRFVAIDLVAVTIVFVITFLAGAFVLAWMHVQTVIEATFGPMIALSLGVSLMWYALVQALTFWLPPGGRSIGGILWPVALGLAGTAHIDGPAGELARALDVLNPLAYMSGIAHTSEGIVEPSLVAAPIEIRLLAVWLFAAAFCAVAIVLWPKREA